MKKSDKFGELASMQDGKVLRSAVNKDTGEIIEITEELNQMFHNHEKGVLLGDLKKAWHLSEIMDKGLFVCANFNTFEEYATARLPYTYEHATKWAKVGRTFGPVLANVDVSGVQAGELASMQDENTEKISSLPFVKVYEMTKIQDTDFSQLLSNGEVQLNGKKFNLQEILDVSTKKWVEQLKSLRDEHSQEIKDREAELDKVVKERDEALAEKEQALQDSETGKKYKALYGERSAEYDAIKQRLQEAHNRALDLNQSLSQIKEMPLEFEALVEELQTLHQTVQRGLSNLRQDNPEALIGEVREEMRQNGLAK